MTLAERIFGSPIEDISPEALLAVLAEAEAYQLDLFAETPDACNEHG